LAWISESGRGWLYHGCCTAHVFAGHGAEPRSCCYTLRIATGLLELAPQHIVSTTLYNDQFPGPLLRLKEGKAVTVDVHNDTDTPELVHRHGLMIIVALDGNPVPTQADVPCFGSERPNRFVLSSP
jgi:hypothetical protein